MKNLYLMRHATAYPTLENDKERMLTPQGVKEIQVLAQQILKEDFAIDMVICSPATRTKQTLQHLESLLDKNFSIEYKEDLYNPKVENFISNIKSTANHLANLLVISHNPTITEVANYISNNKNISFGTATIAKLELDINNWSELSEGCGTSKWTIKPD